MVVILKYMMERLVSKKGYTLIELLVCLSIVSVLVLISISNYPQQLSLNLFKQRLITLLQVSANQAIIDKETKEIYFYADYFEVGKLKYQYPYRINCYAQTIRFTPQATINRANTIMCYSDELYFRLKLSLGSGYLYE